MPAQGGRKGCNSNPGKGAMNLETILLGILKTLQPVRVRVKMGLKLKIVLNLSFRSVGRGRKTNRMM